MVVDVRLGELARLLVGLRHHDVAQRADRGAALELRLRLLRPAALGQRFAIGVDIDLGVVGRAVGDEVHAVLARPGRAGGVRGAVPERRRRLLQRPQRHRHVLVGVVLARIAELVVGQRRGQAVERVDEDVARFRRGDLVIGELIGRHAAPDADLEPAVAQVIEDADLLGEPQRRNERQQIDQRADPHPLGRARERAEIDARHRHEIERGRVVLGDVQAIDAGLIGGGGEFEALVERLRDRAIGGALDMIEDTDFHFWPALSGDCGRMAAADCTIPAGSER